MRVLHLMAAVACVGVGTGERDDVEGETSKSSLWGKRHVHKIRSKASDTSDARPRTPLDGRGGFPLRESEALLWAKDAPCRRLIDDAPRRPSLLAVCRPRPQRALVRHEAASRGTACLARRRFSRSIAQLQKPLPVRAQPGIRLSGSAAGVWSRRTPQQQSCRLRMGSRCSWYYATRTLIFALARCQQQHREHARDGSEATTHDD